MDSYGDIEAIKRMVLRQGLSEQVKQHIHRARSAAETASKNDFEAFDASLAEARSLLATAELLHREYLSIKKGEP